MQQNVKKLSHRITIKIGTWRNLYFPLLWDSVRLEYQSFGIRYIRYLLASVVHWSRTYYIFKLFKNLNFLKPSLQQGSPIEMFAIFLFLLSTPFERLLYSILLKNARNYAWFSYSCKKRDLYMIPLAHVDRC